MGSVHGRRKVPEVLSSRTATLFQLFAFYIGTQLCDEAIAMSWLRNAPWKGEEHREIIS